MELRTLAQQITIGEGTSKFTINSGIPGLSGMTISKFVTSLIPYVFAIAGVGLLLMIIFAGFTLMTSAGDAKKMEAGKNRLTYAVLGFVIVFTAYWIVSLLGTALGMTTIQQLFK